MSQFHRQFGSQPHCFVKKSRATANICRTTPALDGSYARFAGSSSQSKHDSSPSPVCGYISSNRRCETSAAVCVADQLVASVVAFQGSQHTKR